MADIGDFDSISYCAVQAAMQIHSIETTVDFIRMKHRPDRQQSFVSAVQAFFDGFVMGARFQEKKGTIT